jgi:hypothetical protein
LADRFVAEAPTTAAEDRHGNDRQGDSEMTRLKKIAAASAMVLTLSAVALTTAALAANSNWRNAHAGRWHGAAGVGSAYGHARYGYQFEGPGFYRGYGHNANNWCYPGESMYDGC